MIPDREFLLARAAARKWAKEAHLSNMACSLPDEIINLCPPGRDQDLQQFLKTTCRLHQRPDYLWERQ